jgi:hypothetical protein
MSISAFLLWLFAGANPFVAGDTARSLTVDTSPFADIEREPTGGTSCDEEGDAEGEGSVSVPWWIRLGISNGF